MNFLIPDDKKLTDNEIIKALECCVNWGGTTSCADCPLHNTGCLHFNKLKEVLDFINRQKAEIERLRNQVIARDNILVNLTTGSEIYRHLTFDSLTTLQIKAEAIKEFVERLKERFSLMYGIEHVEYFDKPPIYKLVRFIDDNDIDNLVKEMVGGGNDK